MRGSVKRKFGNGASRLGEEKAASSAIGELAALRQMSVNELKEKWTALFGTSAPNNSRGFLELRIGYRIQELIHGGLSRETRKALDRLADEYEGKLSRKAMASDPRNPLAGTRLVRDWGGVEHSVTVCPDGYEWQGLKFKSLSAVAKTITGSSWNGFVFFGLRARQGART
jgi:hypothetical protein